MTPARASAAARRQVRASLRRLASHRRAATKTGTAPAAEILTATLTPANARQASAQGARLVRCQLRQQQTAPSHSSPTRGSRKKLRAYGQAVVPTPQARVVQAATTCPEASLRSRP